MENITQPAPKFAVGDRVRVVGNGKAEDSIEHFFKIGTIGEVIAPGEYMEIFNQHIYQVQAPIWGTSNAHQMISENDLEKVESKEV